MFSAEVTCFIFFIYLVYCILPSFFFDKAEEEKRVNPAPVPDTCMFDLEGGFSSYF